MVQVTLIHTVSSLPATFDRLIDAKLGDSVEVSHIVDEMLLTTTRRSGSIQTRTERHLEAYGSFAVEDGADAILVTCSSVGPAVERIAASLPVPVLRVDEAMADEAVASGRRIGVLATLETTMAPTVDLIERTAQASGKEIEVVSHLVDGAFEAVTAGDVERHDHMVRAALEKLISDVDVVVLAQASMARVVATLPPEDLVVPVLSSPGLAVDRLAAVLSGMEKPIP